MRFAAALFALLASASLATRAATLPRTFVVEGVLPEHKLTLAELDPALPPAWSGYTHVVLELRASSTSTERPYPQLVDAARATHRRLHDVHAGKVPPVNRKPLASEAGAPSSPWDP